MKSGTIIILIIVSLFGVFIFFHVFIVFFLSESKNYFAEKVIVENLGYLYIYKLALGYPSCL